MKTKYPQVKRRITLTNLRENVLQADNVIELLIILPLIVLTPSELYWKLQIEPTVQKL